MSATAPHSWTTSVACDTNVALRAWSRGVSNEIFRIVPVRRHRVHVPAGTNQLHNRSWDCNGRRRNNTEKNQKSRHKGQYVSIKTIFSLVTLRRSQYINDQKTYYTNLIIFTRCMRGEISTFEKSHTTVKTRVKQQGFFCVP